MRTILITGCSGFIGYHLTKRLLNNYNIIGIDNLNDYYDIKLKKDRLRQLENKNFKFIKCDISNKEELNNIFNNKIDIVINLAAQAGVRYSIENPDVYIKSNIIGFYNILECCRNNNIKKIIYASSSSVYGESNKTPFNEQDNTDNPVSLYAATKKTDEILANTYSNLYNITCIGLRFFTVYGPWGRPDMAYYTFTEKMIKNEPINLYNYGKSLRDFTYIDDIVEGLIKTIEETETKIYNIGSSNPIELLDFVNTLKQVLIDNNLLKNEINFNLLPPQPGDVTKTYADTSNLEKNLKYKPKTKLYDGLNEFIKWYKEYYNKSL